MTIRGYFIYAFFLFLPGSLAAQSPFEARAFVPDLRVGCDAAGKDAFGDGQRKYCWLALSNVGNNSGTMETGSTKRCPFHSALSKV